MAKDNEASLLLRIKEVGADILDKTGDSLKGLGKMAATAFAEVVAASALAIHAFKESESATNALNQSLIRQGIYTKETSQAYQEMAAQLQKTTTFDDDAIVAAEALIQAHIGQTHITKELLQATVDLAAAKKMDLASAAEMIGKTIGSETNALARQGIQIDANLPKQEKMAEVIRQVEGAMGGQAQAAAKGLGVLDQLKNTLSDFLENAGQRFAPVVISWAQALKTTTDQVNGNRAVMDDLTKVFTFFAQIAIIAKNSIMGIAEALSGALGTAVGAISQLIDRNFKMAWETLKDGAVANVDQIKARYETLQTELANVDAAILAGKAAAGQREIDMIKANDARKLEIAAEASAVTAQSFQIKSQEELATLQAHLDLKASAEFQALEKRYKAEQDFSEKLKLEAQKRKMLDEATTAAKIKQMNTIDALQATMKSKEVTDADSTFQKLAEMQDSNAKGRVAVAKAAAKIHIGISTAQGAIAAYASLSPIPIVGPALGAVAAGLLIAYGAEQIIRVNTAGGLAEGGIVRATPGGVHAIIGEGGRDEAVIPLENGRIPGSGGGGITIVVNGGMLGDDNSARQFAIAVDRELLKLRQANQSQAFDGVI